MIIWDTAGQDQYMSIAKLYYRDAAIALMVYDVTRKDSFYGLKKWHEELIQNS